jgi:hypothetical protein
MEIIYSLAEITSSSGKYTLKQDIILTSEHTPIPTFTGVFDGNCFKIIGLKITSSDEYSGLFAVVSGEVKNITLENVEIVGNNYVGGLAGHLNNASITNIYIKGEVAGSGSVGGIAGRISGGSIDGGHITAGSEIYGSTVGGIAGTTESAAIITNSSNAGKISGTATGTAIAGGIAGSAEGATTISNSYSSADVSADGAEAQAGGIAGQLTNSTITSSFTAGSVLALGSPVAAGGIVGYIDTQAEVSDSYSKADVEASGNDSAAGGIAGLLNTTSGEMFNTYSTGSIIAEVAGGLIGEQEGVDLDLSSSVAINSLVNGTITSGTYVGAGNVSVNTDVVGGTDDPTYKTLTFYTETLGWLFGEGNPWRIEDGVSYPTLHFEE